MNREEAKKRAQELVGRMTIEERAGQLMFDAPAIKRLGIPAYNWWSEGRDGCLQPGQRRSLLRQCVSSEDPAGRMGL